MRKIETIAHRIALQFVIRPSSIVVALGILCLLIPAKASAQSSNNRWLLVFNTSSAMRDRAKALQGVTQDLLTTGMHGNMRAGDTIGIWTYDRQLRADEAPLLKWSPEKSDSIARHTIDFLSHHRYEKSAVFGDVLENMMRVVKISDTITIVLISDGSDPVIGTPFDASITAFYKTNYNQQRKADLPIVTVFRGEHGTITTNTLSLTPWVDIPLVPPPPPAPKVVVQKPAPPAPQPVVPSLVVIGRKAQRVTNPANLPDITQEPDDVATPPAPAPAQTGGANLPASQPQPTLTVTAATPTPTPSPLPVANVEPTPSPAAPVRSAAAPVAETPKPVEPAPASSTTTGNNPTMVLARETANPSSSVPSEGASAPENWATSSPAPVHPAAEATATAPVASLFSARNIAIVSTAFSVFMCVLLIIVARGARNAARASLITRSLDREQK